MRIIVNMFCTNVSSLEMESKFLGLIYFMVDEVSSCEMEPNANSARIFPDLIHRVQHCCALSFELYSLIYSRTLYQLTSLVYNSTSVNPAARVPP